MGKPICAPPCLWSFTCLTAHVGWFDSWFGWWLPFPIIWREIVERFFFLHPFPPGYGLSDDLGFVAWRTRGSNLSGFVAHGQYLRCLSTLDLLRYKSFVIAAVPSCLSCASPFKAFGFVLQAINGVMLIRLCGSQAVSNSSSLQIFPGAESLAMAALPAYWSCDLGCRICQKDTHKITHYSI